ncbi:hypothetical protein F7Q99_35060 [Streptomyces kaniharaensis]|uniref:Uncharacterized protein n=1 Tax=Streptomyces kaniharaensis TaxID=212423 RepID=A0A6N7L084_9ACTN|nr:hypothetical protein [Streptomyces kaniharaensis]MQS17262.1 hypothetical protein [Streptomyces kaniharaensis]
MTSRHILVCLPPHTAEAAHPLATRVLCAVEEADDDDTTSYQISEGRYASHFPLVAGAPADDPRLVRSASGEPGRCAGGVLRLLDLAALRDQHAAKAADLYDTWAHATEGMPPARPWAAFAEQWGSDSPRALLAFRDQPRLKALAEIKGRTGPRQRDDDEAALISLDRAGFIDRARRRAVPGHILLELDGTWTADPAGLNSDDAAETGSTAYYEHANAYIDALPADFLVVGVDCRR